MTITKKTQPRSAAQFIDDAPDGDGSPSLGVRKGHKRRQISLTIMPDLLAKVDALAGRLGQSRAAVINMAVYRLVERDPEI